MQRLSAPRRLARAVVAVAREKQITVSAASLAYYAFNSLVPVVILVYAVFAVGLGTGALARALDALTGVGVETFERVFEQYGSDTGGRWRAVALAVVITLWSSHRMFRGVDSVFTEVYGVRKERRALRRYLDSSLVLLTVAVGVTVLVAAGSLLAFRVSGLVWVVLGPVLLLGSLCVLFVPMYYLFSGPETSIRGVLPGAVLAGTVWTVSLLVFRVYVDTAESVQLFGLLGALLLVLTLLYVCGLGLLLGVVLNALLGGHVDVDDEWLPAPD